MAHLLSCRLLDDACTADDLATVTERANACALCEGHDRRRLTKPDVTVSKRDCAQFFLVARWRHGSLVLNASLLLS